MTTTPLAHLLSSTNVGPFAVTNRIAMAPMTRSRAGIRQDGSTATGNVPTDLHAEYYRQRASAGLIITEGAQISERGVGYIMTPGIYSEAQVAGWKGVTKAVHEAGGRIVAQLWHVGRVSHVSLQPNREAPLAPSAIAAKGMAYTFEGPVELSLPQELDHAGIKQVVLEFAHAAKCAVEAGFDAVELHGANGYLIDQFLRDGSNKRTDTYGGSIENRSRFLLEAVDAVVAAIGADRVGVRLSPHVAYNDMHDSDPAALFTYAAEELGKRKLAFLHVIEAIEGPMKSEPKRLSPALRKAFGGTFIANGGYSADAAEAALRSGEADLVSFGAPFIANPDLPARFATGAALSPPDQATFYTGGAKGYVDYPAMGA